MLGDGAYKVTWDAARAPRARHGAGRAGPVRLVAGRRRLAASGASPAATALGREEAHALYGVRVAEGARGARSRRRASRSVEIVEVWTDGDVRAVGSTARCIETRANPYGFIPFVIYPNLREPKQFWGVSDIDARSRSRCAS